MSQPEHRVLIVSGRLLVAQGIRSLLEAAPQITGVEVCDNLYDALQYATLSPPTSIVVDLPSGADFFLDRPLVVGGREVKTIVLVEGGRDHNPRLYVHLPGKTANIDNLLHALLIDSNSIGSAPNEVGLEDLIDRPPLVPAIPQATSLIRARASGPRSERIPSSKREL